MGVGGQRRFLVVMAALLFVALPDNTQASFSDSFDSLATSWKTDLGDRVIYNAATGTVQLELPTRFIDGAYAERYFVHPLDSFDPTQDFTVTWRQKITDVDTGGFVQFGLFDESFLHANHRNSLFPTSTVSFGVTHNARFNVSGYRFNVHVGRDTNTQAGSNTRIELGTWYQGNIAFSAASNTVTMTLTNTETNETWFSLTRPVPATFSDEMRYIGISQHPLGVREVFGDSRYDNGLMTVEIDDISLTQTKASPEPTGASSVLFLPGIQASRLYTRESDGSETLLWEPDFVFRDDNVLRLAMDEAGQSIEDVYVRDVIDFAPQSGEPEDAIYGGFISFLDDLVATGTIHSYDSFAYDWRYDVYDIVENGVRYENEQRYLDDVVEQLAATSLSGKVTIVAHSNGGMLGKALVDELESTNRIDLIDQFIMVGTPQLGTPKAIGSLLHGTDQGLSFDVFAGLSLPIISDAAVREAARNMPGAYGLLPGQVYFDEANDIVVLFDTSDITESWRQQYGNILNTQAELDDFLISTVNNRESVLYQSTNEAIVANAGILAAARETRSKQDSWRSPESVSVTSIVGTGRNTISGFSYEAFVDQICDASFNGCNAVEIYKPVPIISQRGDQTVMAVSATGIGSDDNYSRLFFDMKSVEQNTGEVIQHKNFTESVTVQQVISDLLVSTTTSRLFVSEQEPLYDDQQLLLGTHSPVYLHIEDNTGQKTGQLDSDTIVQEIPDTEWFTHASSSYVIAPLDLEYTVNITGYATGPMTFTSHEITNSGQTLQHKVPIETVQSSTTVTINYDNGTFSPLSVDQDGDGEPEYRLNLDGVKVLATSSESVSYSELRELLDVAIDSVGAREFIGELLNLAERFSNKQASTYFDVIEYRLLSKAITIVSTFEARSILNSENATIIRNYVEKLQAEIF